MKDKYLEIQEFLTPIWERAIKEFEQIERKALQEVLAMDCHPCFTHSMTPRKLRHFGIEVRKSRVDDPLHFSSCYRYAVYSHGKFCTAFQIGINYGEDFCCIKDFANNTTHSNTEVKIQVNRIPQPYDDFLKK